ncbi:MAG: BrnT family toxin [Caldilineaceae bacterium SB0661_bin_32]|uniref:BrnT family toxin n=1 Tax=Caldilineaceae bacterium SB0661_bin_32 TaxID=2605255 RepID=A0A6B1D926_9CHLR|nr:BrnT family toxin [Caldilineaceae bacterium SB0661_bin_32]
MGVGRVESGILTVRFTYRANKIRIFGAGYWRKYRALYLEQGTA